MATEQGQVNVTVESGADNSAKQYFFMSIAADGQCDNTGADGQADGVLQNKPAAAGRAATLCILGITKITAGAAITRGDDIGSDAAGKAKTADTSSAVMGKALEAATADGDVITMLYRPNSKLT